MKAVMVFIFLDFFVLFEVWKDIRKVFACTINLQYLLKKKKDNYKRQRVIITMITIIQFHFQWVGTLREKGTL